MKCLTIILFLFNFTVLQSYAQYVNPEVRRGNREYKAENFTEAEMNYRKALEEDPQSLKALYNLANTLYRQGRYEEAANILDGISNLNIPDNRRADAYHNLGNARMGNQQIQEGIDAYKNSLRLRPDDNDTRHNLAMAMKLLQEQEQQQQQDQDGEDDQQQDEQQQQPQDGDDEQQDEPQQQQPQPRPDQISPEDAQRILDALNQQEQEIQEKIEREDRQRRPERPLREW
ncbi:MAG: tetratricopeptide repeat protein [Bacteroidales bacterium]|nr:tetratricopeptide repeat protein [Bacteroidales bacterium]